MYRQPNPEGNLRRRNVPKGYVNPAYNLDRDYPRNDQPSTSGWTKEDAEDHKQVEQRSRAAINFRHVFGAVPGGAVRFNVRNPFKSQDREDYKSLMDDEEVKDKDV